MRDCLRLTQIVFALFILIQYCDVHIYLKTGLQEVISTRAWNKNESCHIHANVLNIPPSQPPEHCIVEPKPKIENSGRPTQKII